MSLSVTQYMAHPAVSAQIFEALVWLAVPTLPVLLAGEAVLVVGRASGAITVQTTSGATGFRSSFRRGARDIVHVGSGHDRWV